MKRKDSPWKHSEHPHHPPWMRWNHDHRFAIRHRRLEHRPGLLFLRFLFGFGFVALFLLGGMAAVA